MKITLKTGESIDFSFGSNPTSNGHQPNFTLNGTTYYHKQRFALIGHACWVGRIEGLKFIASLGHRLEEENEQR